MTENPGVPKATDKDYLDVQGGRPTKKESGNLTTYVHNYPGGEGMEVKSHKDYGEVNLMTPDGIKQFNVGELRALHGDPCERSSRKLGGRGYDRED